MLKPASSFGGFFLNSKLETSPCDASLSWDLCVGSVRGEAHRAGSRVGYLPSVGHPLVIGALLVGKGAIEDHANVGHRVDTNC